MIALIIILILGASLFLPLTIDLKFDEKLDLKLKYSGITIFDNKKKTKANKKSKKSDEGKKTAKKDNFIKTTYREKGLLGTINFFADFFTFVFKKLLWLIKRFKFKNFKLQICVAGTDAAATAINYGKVCAAVYPAIALLEANADLKSKQIDIDSDFDNTHSNFKISVSIVTNLLYWIVAAISVIGQYLKLQNKESEKDERKQS